MNPNQPIQSSTGEQLDPTVVNLAKSIRQVESGGNYGAVGKSREVGAYQYTPETWKAYATKYLGDPNANIHNPINQDKAAYYAIKELKDKGHSPEEVASIWNSGKADAYLKGSAGVNQYGAQYDVPKYVNNVIAEFQKIKGQTGTPNGDQHAQSPGATASPYQSNAGVDSPLQAAGKTMANFIPSALNFGKGLLEAVNPLNVPKNVIGIADQLSNLNPQTLGQLPSAVYENTIPQAGRSLLSGDIKGAQNSIVNDPVGQIAPFLLGGEGLAKFADAKLGGLAEAAKQNATDFTKTGKNVMPQQGIYQQGFEQGISKTADMVTKPAGAVISGVGNVTGSVLKSAASHLTSLSPDTIAQIISNPEAFSRLKQDQIDRGGLANEFGTSIDNLEGTLNESGAAYTPIRQTPSIVVVPENFIPSVLNKFGLKLEQGKVIADSNSITRNAGDINAIQNFVSNWGEKTQLTPNEYLNMRKDIQGIARFGKEIGTHKDAQIVGKELYGEANRTIRPQIQGLKQLDEHYSPIRQQFDQVKRDFLKQEVDGSYSFKDGAINKIANAAGVGKDALISRMEEVMPGITQRIKVLKAVEDIEHAKGIKVGAYAKGAIEGFAVAGNVGAVIAAILSNPAVAVPLLRGLGWGASKVAVVVQALKLLGGDINNFKLSEDKKNVGNPSYGKFSGNPQSNPAIEAKLLGNQEALPAPKKVEKPIALPGGKENSSYVKSVDAGKIKDQYGDIVGYSSTGKGANVKREYSPYTPSEKLPVIKAGSGTKKVEKLPVIE